MKLTDFIGLIHPVIAIILVYPLIGVVGKLAWETRQRRLQETTDKGSSKIPRTVGPEHLSLGRWLSGSIVGITLIGLAYPIYVKTIIPKEIWTKAPLTVVFITLMFILTIASFVLLYQAKEKLWRWLFAILSGIGVIILGFQDGVYRRDHEWYASHFYFGILATLLMIFSLAIVPEIYRDRSNRWRQIHTIANCLAILLFLLQAMTGSRDLLEIAPS